jgi:diguanylate cyclase (GGDEF)-like protein
MIDQQKFNELKSSGNLPSPKGSALKIIELCQRSSASLPEIIHAIQTDPALTGRVVKLANSPVFGRQRPVVSLAPDILMSIGTQSLRQVVLAFSLVSSNRSGSCQRFDYQLFWSKSIATGVAAQLLGAAIRVAPPVELFTCGLLAQVGKLALAAIQPQKYSDFLGRIAEDPSLDPMELELESFGLSHTQISAAMMGDWGIPKLFTDAVLFHENPSAANLPEDSRSARTMWCLHLAERLSSVCFVEDQNRKAALNQLIPIAEKLGLSADYLIAIGNQMLAEWADWSALLEMKTHHVPPFTEDELEAELVPEQASAEADQEPEMRTDILVVDDDPAVLLMLKKLLSSDGHGVHTASNGEDALRIMLEYQPRILITDWLMGGMDGLELVRTLRETEMGQGIYVIMLTSQHQDENLIHAFDSGVDDFIIKPIEPTILRARLKAGLRIINVQRKLEQDRDQLHRLAAELTIAHQHARESALTDSLTGLYNRRYAMDRLSKEWMASERNRKPLSIMVLDIDHFKLINDTHGHHVGDVVLKHVSETLKELSRGPDVPCRIGGEEFLIIIPETGMAGALQYAERIRTELGHRVIETEGIKLNLTVSIGIAQKSEDIETVDQLLKMGDEAMYRAKHEGRNRVVAAS